MSDDRELRRTAVPKPLAVGPVVAILVVAIGVGLWLSTYRAASVGANGCGSLEAGAVPQSKPVRTIRLDQRWTSAGVGTLCVAGIRVYEGSFEIVSYEEGPSSWAQPWTAAHAGLSLGLLSDDRGRTFPGGSRGGVAAADGTVRIDTYGTIVFPTQQTPQADLLAGVHELHLKVDHVLKRCMAPGASTRSARRVERSRQARRPPDATCISTTSWCGPMASPWPICPSDRWLRAPLS